jgi:transposase
LDAGRGNPRPASAPSEAKPAHAGAHAGEERGPRCADPPTRRKAEGEDLFGLAGRRWLERLELPVDERETVDASLRQIDFLDQEIADVERVIAADMLHSAEIKRLMSVPGVNVITATTFCAAIGDVRRFATPRRVVGYLGLDPRVRQSGPGPAKHGRISKQGSAPARYALVEAAWSVIRQPGPPRAFYNGCVLAVATKSRLSPRHASSPVFSGACSPKKRTMRSRSPR